MSSPPQPGAKPVDQPPDGATTARRRGRTRPWIVVGGLFFALLAVGLWRPLQQRCLAVFLLRAEAPTEEALSQAVSQAENQTVFLKRLWETGRLRHRLFVVRYVSGISASNPGLFQSMEPLLTEAASDADIETRQLAFSALQGARRPQLRRLALEQLSDTDPAARLLGLQSLRRIATTNDVAIAMRLLDDPEPRVVVAAAMLLREVTGHDFGIRSTHALPQFTCVDTNPPPAPDLVAIAEGVLRWQQWWNQHQPEYPAAFVSPAQRASRLGAPDFALEDSTGTPVRLSQFRGRPVVLAFWSAGSPASLDDAPGLIDLQRRNPGRLAVLGICIPAAPCCADEGIHGNGHAHHHAAATAAEQTPAEMRSFANDAAHRLNIDYPMLADPKGNVVPRFITDDLPVYILIDSEGNLRRRAVGFRTEKALSAMIEEISASEPAQLRTAASGRRG